jgi:hypothetical protein
VPAVADRPADILRPFARIALASFSAGFWGYLAFASLFGR